MITPIITFTTIFAGFLIGAFAPSYAINRIERRVWKKADVIEELKAIREEIAEARAMQDRTQMMFALHGVDDEANKLSTFRLNNIEYGLSDTREGIYDLHDRLSALEQVEQDRSGFWLTLAKFRARAKGGSAK